MAVWGVISAAQTTVNTFPGLVVARSFIGFVEAVFFPGALFYLSLLYNHTHAVRVPRRPVLLRVAAWERFWISPGDPDSRVGWQVWPGGMEMGEFNGIENKQTARLADLFPSSS